MNGKRSYVVWITIFMTLMLVITGGISQAFDTSILIAPKEAERAAKEGLQSYLDPTSDWELPYFNFHSRDEFKKAKVGTPFRVFFITHRQDMLEDPKKSLIDLVIPTPEWFFTVISKDEYRTILKVAFMKNEWKAVGIGDSRLAKPFAQVMTDWPASKGYNYVFVRDEPLRMEFIILIHPQKTTVIPLPSAIKVWGLKEQRVMEQSEAITLLRDRLKQVFREPNIILH